MDETFHLTPLDVRRYDFGHAFRGYDPERVEQFREQVAEEMERLARAGQDFEQKAKGFHEQLRAFRERDKALNDALVSAQQLRAEIRETAEREAAVMMREAEADANRVLDEARHQVRAYEAYLHELDRVRRNHLTQMRVAAERHLAQISAEESAVETRSLEAQLPPAPKITSRASQGEYQMTGDGSGE